MTILPNAYCPHCEVAWLRGALEVCWLCGGKPSKPPQARTSEEKAELLLTRLRQGLGART